jgi:hypothetical protein
MLRDADAQLAATSHAVFRFCKENSVGKWNLFSAMLKSPASVN